MGNKSLSERLNEFLGDMRRQGREALEKRLYELTAAYQIAREASSIFDLGKCLKLLVERIADLMAVDIVSIMLIDKEKSELMVKLARGLDAKIIRDAKIKVGEGVSGWIAKTGKPLLIKDIGKDKRFQRRNGKYNTDSLLSVPLKIENKVIGVINVNNKRSKDVFTKEDLNTLQAVADMASIAIENARLQEEAKTLDKIKSDFIANVSHELRTPLAAIKESVSLILDGITGKINDKQKKFLELSSNNIERLTHLIEELLELSQLESKKADTKRAQIDITALAKASVDSLKPLAARKKVSLQSSFPRKKIKVWASADKINQAITNLIGNAIKYNKSQGDVEVTLEDTGKFVSICISDTGVGIPKKDLSKIFKRFQRGESLSETEGKGAGLGLSITNEIVRMHEGRIKVESEVGKGSKFIMILPKDLRR